MKKILKLQQLLQESDNESFLLDLHPGASLALSTKKLSSGAVSCAKVFRSSTEIDVTFDSNNFGNFLLSDEIITFYDQSGNNHNFSQTLSSNRPTVIVEDEPSILFDGVDDFLELSLLYSELINGGNNTIFIKLEQDSSSGANVIFSNSNTLGGSRQIRFYATFGDTFYIDFPVADRYDSPQNVGWDDNFNLLTIVKGGDNPGLYVNGDLLASPTANTVIDTNIETMFYLGNETGSLFPFKGKLRTLLIYPNSTIDRLSIESLL